MRSGESCCAHYACRSGMTNGPGRGTAIYTFRLRNLVRLVRVACGTALIAAASLGCDKPVTSRATAARGRGDSQASAPLSGKKSGAPRKTAANGAQAGHAAKTSRDKWSEVFFDDPLA